LTFVFMNIGIGLGFTIITVSSIKFINTIKNENK